MAPLNILVTGACGVTPRAIARSLRASSHFPDARLVGADRGGNWYGFYEGLYERVYRDSEEWRQQFEEAPHQALPSRARNKLRRSGLTKRISRCSPRKRATASM